jgi:hypothetical protein
MDAICFELHAGCSDDEVQAFKQDARFRAERWVVRQIRGWRYRFRRILIHWEKKSENYLALWHFAYAWIVRKTCPY